MLLFLSACATTRPVVDQTPQQDLFEIERLANQTYENSEWLESEKHYSLLIEIDPEKSRNWFRLGNIYARTNRPDAAIYAYREALIRDSELTNAWYNMGIIQLKQAAYSLNEMQLYVDENDPVAEKGQRILQAILDLIEGTNQE
jgi:tetratricopeptide (TPR) repeat protein